MIKKQKRLIAFMLALVAVGLAVYFLFLDDPIEQPPDRITVEQMYDKVEPAEIAYINIHNSHDDYTLIPYLDGSNHSFYIKGYADYPLNAEVLAYLKAYALNGYIVYDDDTGNAKIFEDVTEAELKEYGLDEASDPAYYEIYLNGAAGAVKYVRAYIGRAMYSSKQSYYVMLESDPTTVYQVFEGLQAAILQPITTYITPVIFKNIAFENSNSIMYQVGEFRISRGTPGNKTDLIDAVVSAKDMDYMTVSYRVRDTGEKLDITRMFTGCLNNILVGMTGESVIAMSPDEATLDQYGLGKDDSCYELHVTYASDYGDVYDRTLDLRVSELQEDGYYYLMSAEYEQMLTRVEESMFECFTFNFENWVSTDTFRESITDVVSMTVTCDGYMDDTFDLLFAEDESVVVSSRATGMIWRDTTNTGYNRNNFRSFFMVLLTNTNWESVTSVSEEELNAAVNNPDALLMTLTVRLKDGTVNEYKYYRISQFYAAISVNGEFRHESNLNNMDYMRRAMTYLYEGKTINYLSFFDK
ncbi:MAG: hypothetical protein J6D21_01485 [Clostridia bacterium]|nr:hypothetical protein [Clostridia bacterium]